MKKLLAVMAAVGLASCTGCSSLHNAGVSEYTVKPFKVGEDVVCCEVHISSGKELSRMTAKVVKKGDDFQIDLDMQGIKAFEGQEITGKVVRSVTSDTADTAQAVVSGATGSNIATGVIQAVGAAK